MRCTVAGFSKKLKPETLKSNGSHLRGFPGGPPKLNRAAGAFRRKVRPSMVLALV